MHERFCHLRVCGGGTNENQWVTLAGHRQGKWGAQSIRQKVRVLFSPEGRVSVGVRRVIAHLGLKLGVHFGAVEHAEERKGYSPAQGKEKAVGRAGHARGMGTDVRWATFLDIWIRLPWCPAPDL